jgi:hypothetical protein
MMLCDGLREGMGRLKEGMETKVGVAKIKDFIAALELNTKGIRLKM